MICDEVRTKLEAYVDSELTAGEQAELESHLQGCGPCATDALGLMKMKHITRAAAVARYAPSPEFRLQMQRNIRGKGKAAWTGAWLPRMLMTAAAVVLLVASVSFWVNRTDRERAFAELTDMHVATLASANPVDVISTDRHTVKPWFAGRIPFSFNLPELLNSEFTLAGGRVAYFHHSPGAQLLFHLRKHELSVFIFQEEAGELPFSAGELTSTKLAFRMESWSEGGLRYFIVGDAAAADVHALSELMKRAARS
jgi:anti-sigma factor RsiW